MGRAEEEEIRAALQKARKWSAWQLRWTIQGVEVPDVVDFSAAEHVLGAELQGFFQDFAVACARCGEKGDRVAFRVSISERASAKSVQRRTATVYLLYFLRSDLVLASAMKAEYAEYLRHALCRTLGCDAVADRGLSGRQVEALKDLVLKPSWTPDLLATIMSDRPSVAGKKEQKKRALSADKADAVGGRMEDAVEEVQGPSHREGVSKRLRLEDPGTSSRPPVLEHISIRVMDPNGSQVMKVSLNGPDALQGIRDMAKGGLLPDPPQQVRDLVLGIGVPSNDIELVLGTR